MDLGQALLQVDEQLDEVLIDDEDVALQNQRRAELPILDWPVEDFLKTPRKEQVALFRTYRYIEPDDTEWESEPPRILEILSELPDGKTGRKKAGDKWMSPGRMVCSWPNLDPTARLVMFVISAHGNDKGQNIYIAQPTIARYLGLSVRTVQRALGRLATVKAITMTAQPRQHKAATWQLNQGPGVT